MNIANPYYDLPSRSKRLLISLSLLITITAVIERGYATPKEETTPIKKSSTTTQPADPFLWLEEIEGEKALSWVKERNKETLGQFESDAHYSTFLSQAEAILNAKDRIPYGSLREGYVYNFWQDEVNVRGLWRRAPLSAYREASIKWESILDLDALALKEKENWIYKGATCAPPTFKRCLLRLSRGGKDASVYREFDVEAKSFVKGGFMLPEAKSDAEWIDEDTLLVGTNWGEGSLTASGYPRVVKMWRRGQPLDQATTVKEGIKKDIGVWPGVLHDGESSLWMTIRSLTFFTAEYELMRAKGEMLKIPVQESAELKGFYRGHLLFSLREAWTVKGETYPQGALIAFSANALMTGTEALPPIHVVYAPDQHTSIQSVKVSKSGLMLSLIEHVKGKVMRFEIDASGQWTSAEVPLPKNGSISIVSASPFEETLFFNYENQITPDQLFEYHPKDGMVKTLKQLPHRFNAKGLVVNQYFVKSADGTKVPYFVMHKRDLPFDGTTPTLLYGYGGFEVSLTPRYSAAVGKLWLERGGAYAIANIRGGGEYGPRWHKAALKENRQRAYDDFMAVAEDLIKRKVASPKTLGVMGGSNGGLLMGVALTQRPELFNAIVCQVPLLDMYRYTQLLAGASWAAEYGDPKDPKMWSVISRYSPYHNLKETVKYPKTFFLTSTKDDRVHPGHARKMVAKMMGAGHPVYYYENTEGGHSAGANLKQHAKRYALEYVYLSQRLGLP